MMSEETRDQMLARTGYDGFEGCLEYGADLGSLVGGYASGGDWLEAALHAGHLPSPTGAELALVATHLQTSTDLDEYREGGHPVAVLLRCVRYAEWYRALAVMLGGFAQNLDQAAQEARADAPEEVLAKTHEALASPWRVPVGTEASEKAAQEAGARRHCGSEQ